MKTFGRFLMGLVLAATVTVGAANAEQVPESVLGDDGLYTQEWFAFSFLNLPEDLAEANGEGKRLAIIWEQKGCPYCKDMHLINFADAETNKYVRENFHVIQMNLWGDKEVVDFDGTHTTEKEFARKYNILFTPTIQFLPEEVAAGASGQAIESFRMPGYFRPFHFLGAFEFVKTKYYEKEPNFQRFILEKFANRAAEQEKQGGGAAH